MREFMIAAAAVALTGFLSGCQPAKEDIVALQYTEEQKQIETVVHDVFEAAKRKDFDRLESFHLSSTKFTKFDDWEPLTRQDAPTALKAEKDAFGQISDFNININEFKADVFGDVAIATFVADYSMKAGTDQLSAKARSTLVFVKVGGSWKITHEHFSPFKSNP